MDINVNNPIIKYSEKGKPFQYDKLFYATLNDYILSYKNVRLEKLTDHDQSICLARIIRKMEVNNIPVQTFFKEDLDSWKDCSNRDRVFKLCELMAHDIFCCFDKNRVDEDGNFARVERIYCVNNDDSRDYIKCNDMVKKGLFKKVPSPQNEYYTDLIQRNSVGLLPRKK